MPHYEIPSFRSRLRPVRPHVTSIGLSYAKDSKIDEFGNVFRYRGRDRMNAVDYDHRVYDVYLVGTNAE